MPKNGLFFFFDIQPIPVKAYGGQRWTIEKELVLASNQKTRGMFYLFLAYEAKSGYVFWAFYRNKNSQQVCRFMRSVRRHYQKQQIWIALDQDRAHPRISHRTRGTMRRLKLRWISLPKRSPNDNPVETIFSDIRSAILDNSNDLTPLSTQRRISSYLKKRNRRPDRKMFKAYLTFTDKN